MKSCLRCVRIRKQASTYRQKGQSVIIGVGDLERSIGEQSGSMAVGAGGVGTRSSEKRPSER